jgi:hypothetical protein
VASKLATAAAAALTLLATALPAAASGDTLANARDATAAYNDQASAQAAGYELLTDAAGIACIDQPGAGGMGVHYVKSSLVQSGTIDAARPQALVYEVRPDGRLRLVALEYVVLQATWDASHPSPPKLFGESFMLTPAGNRFGLPAFYALHAWVWKRNPSGTFNPWNPRVRCGLPLWLEAADDRTLDLGTTDGRTPDLGAAHQHAPVLDAADDQAPVLVKGHE